jgi:hypothetical protein
MTAMPIYLKAAMENLRLPDELDPEERGLVSQDFFGRLGRDRSADPYVVYSEVLLSHGVMCPHPTNKRVAGRRWYVCGCCQMPVLGDTVPTVRQSFPALTHGVM